MALYNIDTEEKWQAFWENNHSNSYDPKSEKPLYVIDTPPPFTSGTLHMGHVFNYSLIDFIARYMRMKGFNVVYPQGWDTQGFPTEKVVEKQFGLGLPRKEFYEKCIGVANTNMLAMKAQMKRLGFSSDSALEYVTMSDSYKAKVQLSLILMLEKGMIYRGRHPVEWCVKCRSAIAHAETEEVAESTKLLHLNFKIVGTKKELQIATTRPEMIHACVAIAVNPADERFIGLIGKKAVVPIFDRHVEVIADEKVDKDFGSGAEMVCTFGDKLDMEMFYRHKLDYIEALGEDGKIKNSKISDGLSIKDARLKMIENLSSFTVKIEEINHVVKTHDRCGTPIEFIYSNQWFIKVKEHKEKILQLANEMKWTPEFTKTYLEDWANFIDWDWVISRNRTFGTPIPFWYCEKCGEIETPKKEDLPVDLAADKRKVLCKKCGNSMTGESATCDVWIDSSITPLIISGWPDNKDLFDKAYPTALRSNAVEIIRTWDFYTIFRCWALTGQKPFEEVLINGLILAPDGKRMHKSKGNGISPDELLKKYDADTIRLWAALSGAIGKDRPFSYKDVDFAKSFINKLFNSALFVKTALGEIKEPKHEPSVDYNIFDMWILNRLNEVVKKVDDAYVSHSFYEAANTLTNFYWHEFCDYYIESVKHRIYSTESSGAKSRGAAIFVLHYVLDTTLKMLTPIIPHVAEEINSFFGKSSIVFKQFPSYQAAPSSAAYVINGLVFKSAIIEHNYVEAGIVLNNIIGEVRKAKASGRVALNKEVTSININVPETYYSAVEYSKGEIANICKAKLVSVSVGEYSVSVKI